MYALRIEGFTRNLGAPADWATDGRDRKCHPLTIKDVASEIGPQMISAWEPTPQELAAIARGAPIYLSVCGTTHPPVALFCGAPPDVPPAPDQISMTFSIQQFATLLAGVESDVEHLRRHGDMAKHGELLTQLESVRKVLVSEFSRICGIAREAHG